MRKHVLLSTLLISSLKMYSLTSSEKELLTRYIAGIGSQQIEMYEKEEKEIRAKAESVYTIHDEYSEKIKKFIQEEIAKLKASFAKSLQETLLVTPDMHIAQDCIDRFATTSEKSVYFRSSLGLFEKRLNDMLKEWKAKALSHDAEEFFSTFINDTQQTEEQETEIVFESLFDESVKTHVLEFLRALQQEFTSEHNVMYLKAECPDATAIHTQYIEEITSFLAEQIIELKTNLLKTLIKLKQAGINIKIAEPKSLAKDLLHHYPTETKELNEKFLSFAKKLMERMFNFSEDNLNYCVTEGKNQHIRSEAAKKLVALRQQKLSIEAELKLRALNL